MTNLTDALQEKIDELEEEKERIDTKIELLQELLGIETDTEAPPTPKKRRAGRPKGSKSRKKTATSKHAPEDDVYEEAMRQVAKLEGGGTSLELQKSRTTSFNPTTRPQRSKPSNVHAGTKEQVNEARSGGGKADARVSVDESDLGSD